jgi:phosphoribosylanthranilate isomerase
MTAFEETRIKVCGLTRLEDARLAADLGAWAVGLIFVDASPRAIAPQEADRLVMHLPDHVVRVGVFMNAPNKRILEIRDRVGLDLLQLHGGESPEDCRRLDPARVIKRVASLGEAERYETAYLLVDRPKKETGEAEGEADWELAGRLAAMGRRVLLAGGLTPENVKRAVRNVRPHAVDVAGGVERSVGVKDRERLQAFFRAVREADAPETRETGGADEGRNG